MKADCPPARPKREDRSLKGRFKDLAAKVLSLKMFVFLLGTGLLICDKIDASTWLILAGVVVGIRTAEKKLWSPGGKGE